MDRMGLMGFNKDQRYRNFHLAARLAFLGLFQYIGSVRNSSQTQISENSFVWNIHFSCQIIFEICTEHDNDTAVLCATIWQLFSKLWANQISRELNIRFISDGYSIVQQVPWRVVIFVHSWDTVNQVHRRKQAIKMLWQWFHLIWRQTRCWFTTPLAPASLCRNNSKIPNCHFDDLVQDCSNYSVSNEFIAVLH